jgi:hypothetical protein
MGTATSYVLSNGGNLRSTVASVKRCEKRPLEDWAMVDVLQRTEGMGTSLVIHLIPISVAVFIGIIR